MQNGRNNNSYSYTSSDPRNLSGSAGSDSRRNASPQTAGARQNGSAGQNQAAAGNRNQYSPQNQRVNPNQRASRNQDTIQDQRAAKNQQAGQNQRAAQPNNLNDGRGAASVGSNVQASSQGGGVRAASPPARVRKKAAVTKKQESTLSFLKRTFTVDKTVFEQRAIVREQGSYDYVFLILVIIMLAFGTIMVYSASYAYSKNKYDDSYYIIFRQAIFIVVGFIGMGLAMWFRPEWYRKFALPIYGVCFIMLALVPIIGVTIKGAKRWISLGFTNIQPSEFMKFGLVLMLAWYFDRYYERVTDYKHFGRSTFFGVFVPFVIIGVTCFLVVIEKHLSGTIIMFMLGIIVMFAGGASMKVMSILGAMGGIGLLLFGLLTNYTRRRFEIWLHPEEHPQDGGWQTLQGLYAIGSGGFFGVGLGESRQKHMYVSEPQNDFIFTIVCEELGFVGAVAVIALFLLFAYRGMVIAMKAPDTFSSLVVVGIVGKVTLQALLNIAVVTNSIPNTGISLPFFSYGGSSLCILMTEMGVVLSISRFSKQKK